MKVAVTALFKSFNQVEESIKQISLNNLANNEISFVHLSSNKNQMELGVELAPTGEPSITTNNENSLDGWVVTMNNIHLPNVGYVNIGGPIAGSITSGSTRSLQYSLMGYGVTEDEAREIEEDVAQGKILLLLETINTKASATINIISSFGGKNITKWNSNIDHGMKVTKSP